jgi:hypothetical protein
MTREATSPPEVLSPTPEEIAASATDLNGASGELTASIEAIESYLEAQNIGVPAWVRVKGWSDVRGEFWRRELGYDTFGHEWRIAIRETSGNEQHPGEETLYLWSFNSSPRKARISAADKIPELLRELVKEAARTARRLREKAAEVNAFAATLKLPPTPQKGKR